MKKYIVLIALLSLCSSALAVGSTVYPWPTAWSLKDLAQWAQPLMYFNSTLPATSDASPHDIVVLAEGDGQFSFYRLDDVGTAWESLKFDTTTIDGSLATMSAALANHAASLATMSANLAVAKALEHGSASTDFAAKNLDIHGQISQAGTEPNWRRARLYAQINDGILNWKNVGYFDATTQSTFVIEAKIAVSDELPSAGGLVKRWGIRNGTISVLASEAYCLSGNGGTMSGLVQVVASGTGYSLQCKEINLKTSTYDIQVSAEGTGVGEITQQ